MQNGKKRTSEIVAELVQNNNDNPSARLFFSRLARLNGNIEQPEYLAIAQSVGLDHGVPSLIHTDHLRIKNSGLCVGGRKIFEALTEDYLPALPNINKYPDNDGMITAYFAQDFEGRQAIKRAYLDVTADEPSARGLKMLSDAQLGAMNVMFVGAAIEFFQATGCPHLFRYMVMRLKKTNVSIDWPQIPQGLKSYEKVDNIGVRYIEAAMPSDEAFGAYLQEVKSSSELTCGDEFEDVGLKPLTDVFDYILAAPISDKQMYRRIEQVLEKFPGLGKLLCRAKHSDDGCHVRRKQQAFRDSGFLDNMLELPGNAGVVEYKQKMCNSRILAECFFQYHQQDDFKQIAQKAVLGILQQHAIELNMPSICSALDAQLTRPAPKEAGVARTENTQEMGAAAGPAAGNSVSSAEDDDMALAIKRSLEDQAKKRESDYVVTEDVNPLGGAGPEVVPVAVSSPSNPVPAPVHASVSDQVEVVATPLKPKKQAGWKTKVALAVGVMACVGGLPIFGKAALVLLGCMLTLSYAVLMKPSWAPSWPALPKLQGFAFKHRRAAEMPMATYPPRGYGNTSAEPGINSSVT